MEGHGARSGSEMPDLRVLINIIYEKTQKFITINIHSEKYNQNIGNLDGPQNLTVSSTVVFYLIFVIILKIL